MNPSPNVKPKIKTRGKPGRAYNTQSIAAEGNGELIVFGDNLPAYVIPGGDDAGEINSYPRNKYFKTINPSGGWIAYLDEGLLNSLEYTERQKFENAFFNSRDSWVSDRRQAGIKKLKGQADQIELKAMTTGKRILSSRILYGKNTVGFKYKLYVLDQLEAKHH